MADPSPPEVHRQDLLSTDPDGLKYQFDKILADRSNHTVNSNQAASDPSPAEQKFVDFVLGWQPSEKALWRAKIAILDTVGIAVAGEGFPSSEILKQYARQEHGGSDVEMLFGAGTSSKTGAAFAFAQQCECVDAHDGLNRNNSHVSATQLPAMFSFCTASTNGKDFMEAYAVGLEAFAYCADSLEVEEGRGYIYLPGGLKAGFGAVAGIARLIGLDGLILRHALGIYELHGPRIQTHAGLRVTIWPTMLRDTMAWAAHAATSAVILAQKGFTGIPCGFFKLRSFHEAMERKPTMLEYPGLYIKSYPACRWAHAYVNILRHVLDKNGLSGEDVDSCHVMAERGGAALGEGVDYSVNVDEAHYDLKWPLACQIVEWPRKFGIRLSNTITMEREDIRNMCRKITISFDDSKSNISFNRELSVKMKDGTVHTGSVDEVVKNQKKHYSEEIRQRISSNDPEVLSSAYLLNSAPDDQYMGVWDEQTFKEVKYRPFCEYGCGRQRAEELWQAVQGMEQGETCARFINALTRPLDVSRDIEGGAVDKE